MGIKVNIDSGDFLDKVLPIIQEHGLLTGNILQIEGIDERFLRTLDFHSFDYFIENEEGTLDGLSVRICYQDYKTFTIRKSTLSVGNNTEFHKHLTAMKDNKLRPYWHCQAYILNGQVKRIGIAIKDDIINYIKAGNPYTVVNTNEAFYAIDWNDFQRAGYKMERIII